MTFALLTGYPLLIAAFLWFIRDMQRGHDAERSNLLQRIQAPETAVAQYAVADNPVFVNPVESDSDADWWRGRQERAALAGYDMPIDVPAPHVPDDDLSDLTGVS